MKIEIALLYTDYTWNTMLVDVSSNLIFGKKDDLDNYLYTVLLNKVHNLAMYTIYNIQPDAQEMRK
jgi:hypothetical protein